LNEQGKLVPKKSQGKEQARIGHREKSENLTPLGTAAGRPTHVLKDQNLRKTPSFPRAGCTAENFRRGKIRKKYKGQAGSSDVCRRTEGLTCSASCSGSRAPEFKFAERGYNQGEGQGVSQLSSKKHG